MDNIINRIKRKASHVRLRSIQVFVFHHVGEVRNPLISAASDWTQTEQFKKNICRLQKKHRFISLEEAFWKLNHGVFRFRNYAVLTADDGYRSLLDIIPWLEQQKVPITLFINSKYLDKKSWGVVNEEVAKKHNPDVDMLTEVCPNLFLSKEELFKLNSPLVSVGLHGHEHLNAMTQSEEEFRQNIKQCKDILSKHQRYVPFFAYTWGCHNAKTDRVVKEMDLTPVLVNGMNNYNNVDYINRICIDGKVM